MITSSQNPSPERSQVRNSLGADVEIKGSIRFKSEMFIDGKVEGRIDSDGALTLGQHADIQAEIVASSIAVYGKVLGNITVSERCDLKRQAEFIGDLKAPRLTMEDGATFVGESEVRPAG